MKRTYFLPLASFALIAASAAQSTSLPNDPDTNQPPTSTPIQGKIAGPRTAIFVTPKDSCDSNDVPDAMARAFRDYTGTVHFSSASSELFESYGPSLETVVHSCDRAFASANDTNPANFNDQVWIDSFYTFDGKKIVGLGHTEYHGWAIQGECFVQGQNQYGACEYDSDTFHTSYDGGYHFSTPKPPGNFLAGIPYEYLIDDGPMGYSVDSNIIEYGGWYYAIVTDWTWPPGCSGSSPTNPCLTPNGGAPMRTQDVFDPTSWRAWDGKDFAVSFADPYVGTITKPQSHVYFPVPYMFAINEIAIYQPLNVVVATLWDYWDASLGGPPGMYITTSTDMVHWTKPSLVVTLKDILSEDQAGNWTYAYFSLIDPTAPDLNFSILGEHPYLYYVRINNNNSGERVLFRRPVDLTPAQ